MCISSSGSAKTLVFWDQLSCPWSLGLLTAVSTDAWLRVVFPWRGFPVTRFWASFCRAMLCISAAYAVMRCLSVCLCVCVSVTFVNSVKTNKRVFKFFSPSGSRVILVFRYQTAWQYSDENPLTRASNAGGVGRNRDSEPISGFTAYAGEAFQLQ